MRLASWPLQSYDLGKTPARKIDFASLEFRHRPYTENRICRDSRKRLWSFIRLAQLVLGFVKAPRGSVTSRQDGERARDRVRVVRHARGLDGSPRGSLACGHRSTDLILEDRVMRKNARVDERVRHSVEELRRILVPAKCFVRIRYELRPLDTRQE